ncbi:ComEA family DNA-binding protein [Cognatitamlana onchidii]|uniref:ComEA family DNA-binding protein n=1 Tax=Cognatitamlana onchidii TaxID=2562860 RepID=UPI001F388B82|nr:helix-hairpin-helix domain-containing protein [Algibacter onchidii]
MFTRKQRNGIFLFLALIIILQSIYFFIDFSQSPVAVNQEELKVFINEMDSLKRIELKKQAPKTYPFNPNFIDDYKGSILGMTNEEIDKLLAYRKENKWINSTKQFQRVTGVSDSLLQNMSPYFRFPDWLDQSNEHKGLRLNGDIKKNFGEKQDLNTVTAKELQIVNGVGKVLSERIIKLRNKRKGGFNSIEELTDVYGLTPEVFKNITYLFAVKTPRHINKINLNTASVDDLVTIPHIDYDVAHNIIERRQLREGYKSLNELTKVKDFPVNKINIIELYLHIEKEN